MDGNDITGLRPYLLGRTGGEYAARFNNVEN
jgi:hypothetical protein